MAGEESVRGARRGEAAKDEKKDEKKKQGRDDAKAKSRSDDVEEAAQPQGSEAEVMFSPTEHEDDDDDQIDQSDDEDEGRPHWIPKSFGVYAEVERKAEKPGESRKNMESEGQGLSKRRRKG